uniref:FAD-dependent oxidoreductase n=1 Tax=Ndongobacter massiliensis TaxID=1871025 RepID=UPI0009305B5A|nr:FAD-dependent oxidoreductase [Ndongobacter massiliensis]
MKKVKKFLSVALSATMILSLAACGGKPQKESKPEDSTASESSESVASSGEKSGAMKPGTYTASAQGMNDLVEVTVEVTEDAIKSVEVTKNAETPGIGGELLDKGGKPMETGFTIPVRAIPEKIVSTQNIAVDNVTGATITSAVIKSAVEDCLKQAGANVDDWKHKIGTDIAFNTVESDVVVVGAGGAGLAAAIAAAEQGKTVTLIEKNGSMGGDTLVCGAIYNTPDQELQKAVTMTDPVKATLEAALSEEPINEEHKALQDEVRAQWEQYKADGRTDLFDSKEWYALQTWINGDKVGNLDLVKVLCYNSFDEYQWIRAMGMEFSDKIAQGAGSLWQRTHTSTLPMGTGFMATYSAQLDKYADKIQILLETTATELLTEEQKVVGVKVKDNHSEAEYEVKAKDGVILASGGFGANSEMVQKYNTSGKWADLSKVATTNRFSCSQGDGIAMALTAGASLTDMEQIQLLYLGNTKDGQLTKYPPRDVNGTDQIIFVNKNGERFVREDGRRDEICLGVLSQPDSMFYMLESADGAGYKDITDPEWRSADGFTFDYLKENGYIFVGDTLEEIAKQIGCDPAALQKTVDTFNASVDSGKDEFGRTLYSTKLENGPWVATARQACIHHTMGGVTIDTKGHVLNEAQEPIAGFYAAGEVTGGIHGANRLGGNAVVDTVVFGKLAADTLVEDVTK